MPTNFYAARNNVTTTVASPYSGGLGALAVADGSGFLYTDGAALSATKPAVVSTFLTDGTPKGVYRCEARSGNTLTLTSLLSGTDAALAAGAIVAMRVTAEHLGQVAAAMNAGVGTLWTATADGPILTNSIVDTSVMPTTGVGDLGTPGWPSLPANFLVPGKTIVVEISGLYSTAAAAGTLRFRLKLAGGVVGASSVLTLSNGGSNLRWKAYWALTCRTAGAAGTAVSDGEAIANTTPLAMPNFGGTTPSAVNTTVAASLDVSAQFGTADPANTIRSTLCHAYTLN